MDNDNRKHILIVDDVTTNLKCAAEVLQDTYKLSLAKSGHQALEFLKKVKPDLILLDVRMPELDGYQTLEIIKKDPETSSIPVVFLTVDDQRESEIKGLRMGAMDFILKPFEPQVMLSRIAKILQMEDLRKNLSMTARKDALSGIWNRKYLEDEIAHFLEQKNRKAFFIIIDVDNFKSINDNYGHILGDSVICKIAEILQNSVGVKDTAARLGGDEFAMFLKSDYTENDIKELCQQLLETTEVEIKKVLDEKFKAGVSIGVSSYPEDGIDFESLYGKADKALYFVKQNGKNSFHFYKERETLTKKAIDGADIEADMSRLERMIIERTGASGAYKVEYEGFKHIFHYVSRTIGRTGQTANIGLFTLSCKHEANLSTEVLEPAIKTLAPAVIYSLRQGDVTTRYSSFQYVVLLTDATSEQSAEIAERVVETFGELNSVEGMSVDYSYKLVEAK
ncbi:MAG: diguanylate cyclase [Lachnospiraceae bacterium]|nr:diguanylate cyclase [Lachnospiraceae bacterium]